MADRSHEAFLAREVAYFEAAHTERQQFVEFVRDFGRDAVRTLVLLNAGAIVALLTFVGSLLSRSDAAQFRIAGATLDALSPAFLWFAAGLVGAAFLSGLGYLNYSAMAELSPSASDLLGRMQGVAIKPQPRSLQRFPDRTARLAVAIAILSLVSFGAGAWQVRRAFEVMGNTAQTEALSREPRSASRP